MSLSKQLGVGLFCVLFLVFVGTLWLNIINTRNFIEQQLSSHSQDTATSLGLSISPYIGQTEDLVIIETMTNAIFDSGYYLKIELADTNGDILLVKDNPPASNNVPSWFVSLFSLKSPIATTEINDGWNIKGQLTVVSNPGFGYTQLWNSTLSILGLTAMVFGIALIFIVYLVKRVISQPINSVVIQTEAIAQKQFAPIKSIPKTPELRRFVDAINIMSKKLNKIFTQMSEQSEKYKLVAYTDVLTKVGNRRAFELSFTQTLRNAEEQAQGFILIVRASSLTEVHQELGGELGDIYLQSVSETIKEVSAKHYKIFAIYRITGSEFAVIIESAKEEDLINLCKALSVSFKRKEKSEYKQGMAHIGASEFAYKQSFPSVMERVDNALSAALNTEQAWAIASSLKVSHSNEVWRDTIRQIITKGTSDFAAQPIVNGSNELLYNEWYARLPDTQSSANMPMAQLIPASIRLDYAQELDKLIVENLLKRLPEQNNLVGLNLSRISLFDEDFMQWFINIMHNSGALCSKLVLEIPERALLHDIKSLISNVNHLKSLGIKIAVEHFGAQLAGITHIRQIQPDFLKLDGRFTRNIQTELDNQLFLQSLMSIAQGLNIKVIAEMVETEQERDWLINAGVDYIQGYFVATPQNID